MPHIDGLRAVAVAAVLWQHWRPSAVPVGGWGVVLFFVISGYLITRSVLGLRDAGHPLGQAARIFFWRRAVRLAPALLAIGAAVLPEVRANLIWYLTYTSNVLIAHEARFVALTPTWSLALEEQFYLAWFFAAFLVPRRILPALLLTLAGIAVLYRGAVILGDRFFAIYLLPSGFDALGIGIALCLAERAGLSLPRRLGWAAGGCVLVAAGVNLAYSSQNAVVAAVSPALIALASGWAVWRARTGLQGWPGALIGSPPVLWLGRISYGIYLYHIVSPSVISAVPHLWRVANNDGPALVARVLLTTGMAALSYYALEQPAMRLNAPKPLALA